MLTYGRSTFCNDFRGQDEQNSNDSAMAALLDAAIVGAMLYHRWLIFTTVLWLAFTLSLV